MKKFIPYIVAGALSLFAVSALGVHTYLENKEKEAQEKVANELRIDWQNYYNSSCKFRTDVSFTDKAVRFCTDSNSDKREHDRILEIAKDNGSYQNDVGAHRPKRQYFSTYVENVPKGFGGDFIGVYAGIPTRKRFRSVKVFTDYRKDVCYVVRNSTINVNGREFETVNLEGQLNYCLQEEWRTEHCDTRYGAVVFVQKPDFCKDISTFKDHIQSTPSEKSLDKWKEERKL